MIFNFFSNILLFYSLEILTFVSFYKTVEKYLLKWQYLTFKVINFTTLF